MRASTSSDRPSRDRRSTAPSPYSKTSASRPAASSGPGGLMTAAPLRRALRAMVAGIVRVPCALGAAARAEARSRRPVPPTVALGVGPIEPIAPDPSRGAPPRRTAGSPTGSAREAWGRRGCPRRRWRRVRGERACEPRSWAVEVVEEPGLARDRHATARRAAPSRGHVEAREPRADALARRLEVRLLARPERRAARADASRRRASPSARRSEGVATRARNASLEGTSTKSSMSTPTAPLARHRDEPRRRRSSRR